MPIKKLMMLISLAGLIVLVISIIWWQRTFGFSGDLLKCIAVSDTICKVGGLKSAFGDTPSYSPIAFWVGLVAFVGGSVLRKVL